MSRFIGDPGPTPVAEDKFEAVDPLARVSREQGLRAVRRCHRTDPAGSRSCRILDAMPARTSSRRRKDRRPPLRRSRRSHRNRDARQDPRSGKALSPRDGFGAASQPRRRNRHRAPHRTRPDKDAPHPVALPSDHSGNGPPGRRRPRGRDRGARYSAVQRSDSRPTKPIEAGARDMLAACDELAKLRKQISAIEAEAGGRSPPVEAETESPAALGTGAARGRDLAHRLRDSAAESRGQGSDLQTARGGG